MNEQMRDNKCKKWMERERELGLERESSTHSRERE